MGCGRQWHPVYLVTFVLNQRGLLRSPCPDSAPSARHGTLGHAFFNRPEIAATRKREGLDRQCSVR